MPDIKNNDHIQLDPSFKAFIQAFLKDKGFSGEAKFQPLSGDGSVRDFYRIHSEEQGLSYIAMSNTPANTLIKKENMAYLMIGNHLFKTGISIPQIYRFDLANGWFILEDMGDRHLQDEANILRDRIPLYEKVLELLFRLQIEGAQGFDSEWCFQTGQYDQKVMRRYEADYFRDSFVIHYLGMEGDWSHLEGSFDHLVSMASKAENIFFLHRDFQSRNIMISDNTLSIMDWQGSRLGPLAYDLASLLIDPYVDLPEYEREQIYRLYLLILKDHQPLWVDPFKKYFPYLAIQRNLQILGAFAHLTKVQNKNYFESYIPPSMKSLQHLLDKLRDPKLSALEDLLKSLPYAEEV